MKKVCVVNCDPEIRSQIETCLIPEGFSVFPAESMENSGEKETVVTVICVESGIGRIPEFAVSNIILITGDTHRIPANQQSEGVFIIAAIHRSRLRNQLPIAVRLIHENPRILELGSQCYLSGSSAAGIMSIGNDPYELAVAANILGSILYNYGIADSESREHIIMAFMELLINAVEHGHCRISYSEKTALLEEGRDILAILRERIRLPEIARKKIKIYYKINKEKAEFTIEDEGEGFNWKKHSQSSDIPEPGHLHGRGIAMARHYLSDLSYNEKGNAVSFVIRR